MSDAQLITIGTEITSGEVVNSNAAWVSTQLESLGFRVHSHVTVRDRKEEILTALSGSKTFPVVIVTGGLGPTTDDMTRACLADHLQVPLEFDDKVWNDVVKMYQERQLPLREAHRHQCFFPKGSERLKNPVGTALGFLIQLPKQMIFVLPGPPRELQSVWELEVEPRLKPLRPSTSHEWVRWTCLGAPESEVAELVEKVIAGSGVEVGYRAQVPYVKVKVFVDPVKQKKLVEGIDQALDKFVVARGGTDLGEELLSLWPEKTLTVWDRITGAALAQRLFEARANLLSAKRLAPELAVHSGVAIDDPGSSCLSVKNDGEKLVCHLRWAGGDVEDKRVLPFKMKLDSERGRRSAAEWAIWLAVSTLRK